MRSSQASSALATGSTSVGTWACIRASGRQTSSRWRRCGPSSSTRQSGRRSCWPTGLAAILACPSSCTASSHRASGPRCFGEGAPVSCSVGSKRARLTPDRGPALLDPRAGCVLVGARRPLIAFNVDLATDDLAVAQSIAALVRETGGGFTGVRALGFPLASRGLVQVSMNVEDWQASPLEEIVARIEAEARGAWRRGRRFGARRPHAGGGGPSRGGGSAAREPGRFAVARV